MTQADTSTKPPKSTVRWWRALVVPLAWLAVAAAMAMSWSSDPYDPTVVGTDGYGHNGEGALSMGLVLTAIEAIVLTAALRPWSYTRATWARPLVLLPLTVPWTLLSGVMTMHAGGIMIIHLLWLVVVNAALIGVAMVTAFVYAASRKPSPRQPPALG